MAKSCPECGAAVEYAARSVEIIEGSCSGCGRAVVLLPPPGATAAAVGEAASTSGCWECGGPLTLRARPDRSVEAKCGSCHQVVRLVAEVAGGTDEEGDDEEESEEEEEEEERPRRPFRPRGDRPSPGAWRDDRAPRFAARPCRQCGGTLQFTSNPDGTVTGSCAACGNEFTMRPRPQGAGGPGRRPSWGGRDARPRYSSGPPRRPWRDRAEAPPERRRRRRPSEDR